MFRSSLDELVRQVNHSYQTTLPYTLRGAELTIGAECLPDPLANRAAPMTGRIAEDQLILNPTFSRAAWIFVRVGQ